MDKERFVKLAGLVEQTNQEIRAKRLANEIMPASTYLIERTEDVLQNLDPINDKAIRDMVIENVIELLKTKMV